MQVQYEEQQCNLIKTVNPFKNWIQNVKMNKEAQILWEQTTWCHAEEELK